MKRRIIALLITLALAMSTLACLAEAAPALDLPRSQAATSMMTYLESDPELMALMEKSIAKAREINPDPNTSPVDSVEALYDFIDWAVTCMPWNVLTDVEYPTLYNHIDQSIDYIWFLLDQPLEELEGRGYYYPTLQYHEPIATWCREYSDEWGAFLSTEDSWNDIYYQRIKDDPSMNMQYGWYADENVWHTFNEWFSRHLVDPSVRPIADSAVVAPADSAPQGVWDIDANGDLVQKEGVAIKSANFTSVLQLIGPDSQYADAFNGGTLTHTFLDVNDYHRYHFPVSGTIKEVRKIPAVNGAGGITEWDPDTGRYILLDAIPGWQMIETRDCAIIDTGDYGLVAVLPIGMSQICSCNWEDSVVVGAKVEKGDPMGYFLFGGSDIVMVFQDGVDVEFLGEPEGSGYKHLLMGEPYANLTARSTYADNFFSGLSQAWDDLRGMADDAGQAVSAWANESGVAGALENAGESISAWADTALSDMQSWAEDSGLSEWAQNVSAETKKLIEKTRPAVEAWLEQAGEDVKNAWNTLINAEDHTRKEIEEALETVNDALNDAAVTEAAA